ncbi:insoluble matrix shell protein 6-like [Dreissena polymorpha]|uniref:Kazal-like domain-containing protein n=1 Tax=Dreissena polymorpha TaxID=45954 RepID=A0A9D4IT73_DREPO|nr:insoluble matrix shell protein 6-like [Dreissena polymorpha]KAH3787266.1 hypothetical protein DPMN_165387 [Dreissena polymorpha]
MNSYLVLLAVCVAVAVADECGCANGWAPVCATDGSTYETDCDLHCSGKFKACNGVCPCHPEPNVSPCGCDNRYEPVCTAKGDTYQNKCQADCSGELVVYPHACPASIKQNSK